MFKKNVKHEYLSRTIHVLLKYVVSMYKRIRNICRKEL